DQPLDPRDVADDADHEPDDHEHDKRRGTRTERGARVVEEGVQEPGHPPSLSSPDPCPRNPHRSKRSPTACNRSGISRANRRRPYPTPPPASASRSSSRGRPASARP